MSLVLKNSDVSRRKRGNMLSMTVLCVALILFFCIIAFAFYILLTEQKRGQNQTDRLALECAKVLNEGDRLGQMNTLVERCRELVYEARSIHQATIDLTDMRFATPLAQQLLDEARSSALDVEQARDGLLAIDRVQINAAVEDYNKHARTNAAITLPWWKSYDPHVIKVQLGYINNVTSNVLHNDYFRVLNDHDLGKKYVQKGSRLFLGNINIELPPPDNDLKFIISSLPAPVESTTAPARLVNPDAWKHLLDIFDEKPVGMKTPYAPSALAIFSKMNVSAVDNKESVVIGSFASTTGAGLPPPWHIFQSSGPNLGWGSSRPNNQGTGSTPWGGGNILTSPWEQQQQQQEQQSPFAK